MLHSSKDIFIVSSTDHIKKSTKGETTMNAARSKTKGTTRRGFIKNVASGVGGIALGTTIKDALTSGQQGLSVAQASESKYAKYILAPEIKQYQELQVFEIKGKDMRGYDWALQMAPVEAIPLMNETETVNADRAKAYIGAPDNVKDLNAEIEISFGAEPEVYKFASASVVYIPKGTPYRQRILKKPDKPSFTLTLTLPPKYTAPTEQKK